MGDLPVYEVQVCVVSSVIYKFYEIQVCVVGCTKIALFFHVFKNSQYFVPMILYDHHTSFEQIP